MSSAAAARGARPLALIVDHHADTRTMYALQLESAGITTAEARDAAQALTQARSLLPDIITTDVGLGGDDGLHLCRELKTQDSTRGIPVIVVTGRVMPAEMQTALDCGCVSVLRKPCLPDELLAEIQRVLRSAV